MMQEKGGEEFSRGNKEGKGRRRGLKELVYVPESIWCKNNWIFFGLGSLGILLWLFIPKTPESEMIPHSFSPEVTLHLQRYFGTDGVIAWFSSLFYIFLMMTNVLFLFIVAYFAPRGAKGRMAWMYAAAILIGGIIDLIIYLMYPVAPPIRVEEHLDRGVVPIRLDLIAWSDEFVTLKYCAFPSGHIYYAVIGFFMSREEQFKKMSYYYLTVFFVFSFVIMYLGEHYWIDIVASLILATLVFFPTLKLIDKKYGNKECGKRGNTLATESLLKG